MFADFYNKNSENKYPYLLFTRWRRREGGRELSDVSARLVRISLEIETLKQEKYIAKIRNKISIWRK